MSVATEGSGTLIIPVEKKFKNDIKNFMLSI